MTYVFITSELMDENVLFIYCVISSLIRAIHHFGMTAYLVDCVGVSLLSWEFVVASNWKKLA